VNNKRVQESRESGNEMAYFADRNPVRQTQTRFDIMAIDDTGKETKKYWSPAQHRSAPLVTALDQRFAEVAFT
jgi:hypothetical protein